MSGSTEYRKREGRMRGRNLLSAVLDRVPYIGRLRRRLIEQRRREGRYPSGHYYSPIPSPDDVRRHLAYRANEQRQIPDLDLHSDEQRRLLELYAAFYAELPFGETPREGVRYHFGQEWFRYADAVFLYSHLRHTQPRIIVEVGGGWSTAVMLDTCERFLPQMPRLTCIEPYPDRLKALLRPGDEGRLEIISKPIQEADPEITLNLNAGDLLFIDSSHVLKAGSDLYHILFRILPTLPPGVFVHFHDVFWDFDYPNDWLEMGRFWNEAYLLRAFLSSNETWRVYCFNAWVGKELNEWLKVKMPLCVRDTGGGLYLVKQKKEESDRM